MYKPHGNSFRVKVHEDYELMGTDKFLSRAEVYRAVIANNVPDYLENKSIWVNEFLLHEGEYTIIREVKK